MRNKKRLIALLTLWNTLVFSAHTNELVNTDEKELFIYNQAFAERFSLDSEQANNIADDIYAIKLTMEPSGETSYRCYLTLYVSSELDIFYPGPGNTFFDAEGLKNVFGDAFSPIKRTETVDSLAIEATVSYLDFKAFSASSEIDKNFHEPIWYSKLVYNRYYRDFLPSLSFIKFNAICQDFIRPDAEIWLRKYDHNEENQLSTIRSKDIIKYDEMSDFLYFIDWQSDFYKIPVPDAIKNWTYLTAIYAKNND